MVGIVSRLFDRVCSGGGGRSKNKRHRNLQDITIDRGEVVDVARRVVAEILLYSHAQTPAKGR